MTDLRLSQLPEGDLEAALRRLAPAIDWPSTGPTPDRPDQPDLAAAVRARIEAGPGTGQTVPPTTEGAPRWRWTWRPARRALVLALVALLALAAIAGAIGFGLPGLRLIFGGASVSPPPSLEPSRSPAPGPPGAAMGLGERIELTDLDARAGFSVQWPNDPSIGPPDAAYIDTRKGDQVTLVWAARPELPATLEPGVGLLVSQFRGNVEQGFFQKALDGGDTTVQLVMVDGEQAYWLSGDPHVFFWNGPEGFIDDGRRWVGDVLLWSNGTITYRLEIVARPRRGDPPRRNPGLTARRQASAPSRREPRLPARCRWDARSMDDAPLDRRRDARRPPAWAAHS